MTSVGLFDRRIRGFRVVEVAGLGVLLTLVTSVYLAKTFAGRERQQISQIEQEISDEAVRKRLLEAEVAHLEQPRYIEQYVRQLTHLEPIRADHEITEDALIDVARRRELPRAPISAAPVVNDALVADAPESVPDDVPPPPPPPPPPQGQGAQR